MYHAQKPAIATCRREHVPRVVFPDGRRSPSHKSKRRERTHVADVSSERFQEIQAVFVSRQPHLGLFRGVVCQTGGPQTKSSASSLTARCTMTPATCAPRPSADSQAGRCCEEAQTDRYTWTGGHVLTLSLSLPEHTHTHTHAAQEQDYRERMGLCFITPALFRASSSSRPVFPRAKLSVHQGERYRSME